MVHFSTKRKEKRILITHELFCGRQVAICSNLFVANFTLGVGKKRRNSRFKWRPLATSGMVPHTRRSARTSTSPSFLINSFLKSSDEVLLPACPDCPACQRTILISGNDQTKITSIREKKRERRIVMKRKVDNPAVSRSDRGRRRERQVGLLSFVDLIFLPRPTPTALMPSCPTPMTTLRRSAARHQPLYPPFAPFASSGAN